jgi:ribosome-binding ATPase
VEAEVAELGSEAEKKEFLSAMGIEEPALNILARLLLKTLNLISFFTVGTDEVRQWTVRAGSSAPEAAGAIHSDLQKGFIRAEVIKFNDLKELGSEDALKSQGKSYLKGKDYIVEDADILNIRFNV